MMKAAEIAALRAEANELDKDGMDPRLVREMHEQADAAEKVLLKARDAAAKRMMDEIFGVVK